MDENLSDTVLRSFDDASDAAGASSQQQQYRDKEVLLTAMIQSLQTENAKLRGECLELQRSGADMKILLKSSLDESDIGRELQRVVNEHEKLLKRVDIFKVEKAHLVDNILELSTEVDELQRARAAELAKHKQDSICFADFQHLRHTESVMGAKVIEHLRSKDVDMQLVREMEDSICFADFQHLRHTESVMGAKVIEHLRSKDVDMQLVREVTSIVATCLATPSESSEKDGVRAMGGIDISVFSQKEAVPSPSGRSRRSPRASKKGSRKKDYLDRDENESIISSVSTHRQRPPPQNFTSGQKSSITKAALAKLDRLYDGEPEEEEDQGDTSFLPKDVVNFFSGFFA